MDYMRKIKTMKNSTEMRIWLHENLPDPLSAEWVKWEAAWAFFSAVCHEEVVREEMTKLEQPRLPSWQKCLCTEIGGGDSISHNGGFGGFVIRVGRKKTPIRVQNSGLRLAAEIMLAARQGIFSSIAGRIERRFNRAATPLEKEARALLDAQLG